MAGPGTFTTSDDVKIAYARTGTGPPLLLVHGGVTDHRCFDPILEPLAARFTVTAYDRRGHGQSADAGPYSLDREADDVVEAAAHCGAGEPVSVLGYSYGALAALHAITTRPTTIRALLAYEAPLGVPGMLPAIDEILTLVAAGRHDEALRLFVGSTFRLSPTAVAAMTRHPMWQVSLAAAANVSREAVEVLAARITVPADPVPPVRYLVAEHGGNPAFRQIAAMVTDALPNADTATVPGLPHFAIATEPAAFTARALEHLLR